MKIDVIRDFLLTIDSGSIDKVFLKVFEEAAREGWNTTDGPDELLAKIKNQYHG